MRMHLILLILSLAAEAGFSLRKGGRSVWDVRKGGCSVCLDVREGAAFLC